MCGYAWRLGHPAAQDRMRQNNVRLGMDLPSLEG
jgi:hypothetical protein